MNIIFYDAKNYDKLWFDKINNGKHHITYIEDNLDLNNINQAKGYDSICAFVNTVGNEKIFQILNQLGIKVWLQRSMGYNKIDLKAAQKYNIKVFRVSNYSAESVAEHAITLMMALNRRLLMAIKRTQNWNFSLDNLEGKAINDSTVGVIGAGNIGQCFIKIVNGMGAKIIVYDEFSAKNFPDLAQELNFSYVTLNELCAKSDFISLHAPLLPTTKHMINDQTIALMAQKPILINCGRGELIDTSALIKGLKSGQISGVGLDVLEREENRFYHNLSSQKQTLETTDQEWKFLLNQDNVLVTAHQAFFTTLALKQIATITLENASHFDNHNYQNALQLMGDGKVKNG